MMRNVTFALHARVCKYSDYRRKTAPWHYWDLRFEDRCGLSDCIYSFSPADCSDVVAVLESEQRMIWILLGIPPVQIKDCLLRILQELKRGFEGLRSQSLGSWKMQGSRTCHFDLAWF